MTLPSMPYRYRVWIHGLVAAMVNSVAGATTAMIVDPADFNPLSGTVNWGKLGGAVLGAAVVGAGLYLKKQPLPDPEKDTDAHVVADRMIAKIENNIRPTDDGV